MMIYLYVKTHELGLKYFGKTVNPNPTKYRGSGKYWKVFLKKYPGKVTTEVVAVFNDTDKDECRKFALNFSLTNNIVESHEWANLKNEQLDGGTPCTDADYFKRIGKAAWDSATEKQKIVHGQKIRESLVKYYARCGSHNTGKIRQKVECPHCGKMGAMNTMSRFHFDKCKHKQTNGY